MQITGKILEIKPTVNISETFRKREFIVEYAENAQYPELIQFEAIQEKCDLLDNYQVGQTVDVGFNLKGRSWTNPEGQVKYFNSLQAWRLSYPQNQQAPQQMPPAQAPQPAPAQGANASQYPPVQPMPHPQAAPAQQYQQPQANQMPPAEFSAPPMAGPDGIPADF